MDLKKLVNDVSPLVNKSYSFKYFGLNNGKFGVLSKRVPLMKKQPLQPTGRRHRKHKSCNSNKLKNLNLIVPYPES